MAQRWERAGAGLRKQHLGCERRTPGDGGGGSYLRAHFLGKAPERGAWPPAGQGAGGIPLEGGKAELSVVVRSSSSLPGQALLGWEPQAVLPAVSSPPLSSSRGFLRPPSGPPGHAAGGPASPASQHLCFHVLSLLLSSLCLLVDGSSCLPLPGKASSLPLLRYTMARCPFRPRAQLPSGPWICLPVEYSPAAPGHRALTGAHHWPEPLPP